MLQKDEHYSITISRSVTCVIASNKVDNQDGWPKLREFLGLPPNDGDHFPHENKGASAVNFVSNLWVGTEYETKVNAEIAEYMKRNGYEVKKLEEKPEAK